MSPRAAWRAAIIAALAGLVVLVLGGCSLVKVGYGQAPGFAFRWLDGYVDFDDAQSLRVRTGLDEFFAWHRRTQLPDYAEVLARAQAEVVADVTPERMCAWAGEFRSRVDAALEHALPTMIDVMPSLTPVQLANVEKRYRERNESYRDEFMQRDPAKRQREAVRREVERAEQLYGALDEAQRELVARSVAASPYDAELAYAERLRRQQDALSMMKRVSAGGVAREEAQAQIRAYVKRLDRSPREAYRGYSERLVAWNCAFASSLHNATSAVQRKAAAKKLRGYEADLRELAGAAAG